MMVVNRPQFNEAGQRCYPLDQMDWQAPNLVLFPADKTERLFHPRIGSTGCRVALEPPCMDQRCGSPYFLVSSLCSQRLEFRLGWVSCRLRISGPVVLSL